MLGQKRYKYLFLPHRGTFNEALLSKRFLRDKVHVYAFLIASFPGINDSFDIVIKDNYFYDSRLGLVGCSVCVSKYYDEDFISLYGCPQCIGVLYDITGNIFPKVSKFRYYVKT